MPDVLIFDDDPSIGALVSELLKSRGLTVGYYQSGAGVVQMVKENRPRLIILDVMMPGMDGLSACRSIRTNPLTRNVKIIIMTAKDSRQDKEAAMRYGADLFLSKPFESGAVAQGVSAVLNLPPEPEPAAKPPAPPIRITLLPGGGVLETAAFWIIFDAGNGLKDWLVLQRQPPKEVWMLLSRYHHDAVCEIDAGEALLAAGCRVKLGGPDDPEAFLQRLAPKMSVSLPDRRATPLLYPQREGEFQLSPDVQGMAQYTHHPGLTLAYRIDLQGRRIVYCPAHDINPKVSSWQGYEMGKFRALFSNADLLLFGYRRSLSDPAPDDDHGKGAWEPAVDLAAESKVRHIVLFPLQNAYPVPDFEVRLKDYLAGKGYSLSCEIGKVMQNFIL